MDHHIDWGTLAFQVANFCALLFILIKFGGKGIKEMLKNRQIELSKNITEARALRAEAEQRLHTYEAKLAGIEQEVSTLLSSIRAEAEAEKRRIIAAAEESAARLKRDGEAQLKQEARRLELELRREAAILAVETARELLQTKMTEADQKRLAEQFVNKMTTGGDAAQAKRPEKTFDDAWGAP